METLEDRTAPATLVAAYAFNEGTGTTVTDYSGNGNNGTIANATWTTSGKYGDALVFNGTNARVTIPDATSLHLTTGMTLEAWVHPSTVTSAWTDVVYKGNDNYYLESATPKSKFPAAGATVGTSDVAAYGKKALTASTWAFLTETYDGATLSLYVNGTLVSSLAEAGNIATSTNPLQIGGDSIYGQYFKGTIDEVRVYNGALTAAQIMTDMTTPIAPPQAPAITSAAATTFTRGALGTFTVTASGVPTPSLSETGTLPGGVTFNAATGVLSGTPAAGTGGTYSLTLHRLQRRRQPRHPELYPHGQPGAGDHQRHQHHLHDGDCGQLHGDDHRLPDPGAERHRDSTHGRDVRGQRQRDRHSREHDGHPRRLHHADDHRRQRRDPQRHTDLHPHSQPGAGHHQRHQHHLHGGQGGQLHGDGQRRADPDAERDRDSTHGRDVRGQRQRDRHSREHDGHPRRLHHADDHRRQRRDPQRHPELYPHGRPGAGHHQRHQHHLHDGDRGQLHGDDHRLPDPDADRDRDSTHAA